MVFSQYSPGMIPGWGIWLGQPQDLLFDAEQSFFSVYFPVPPHRNQVNNYVSSFSSKNYPLPLKTNRKIQAIKSFNVSQIGLGFCNWATSKT